MLPYGRQSIDDDDIAAVAEVLRGDFLTTGPKVEEFETALCEATGAPYAVACSNGTTALHLAAIALGLGPGDAAIVPSVTFLATANAARYCGADVIFADVDPETGLMAPGHVEEALSRADNVNVKAIFPVHLTGRCVDIKALRELADRYQLKILADACHAIGGTCHGHSVGACHYEDLATFSFHPVKTIACGEGGAIMTADKDAADKMRVLRNHGMMRRPQKGPWYYDMQELGYNHRLTDMQCALGLSQLKKLRHFVEKRAWLKALYDKHIAALAPVIKTPAEVDYGETAWHLYAVQIDFNALGMSRAQFMDALKNEGIGSQVHYIPVHTQPYYQNLYGSLTLPGAEKYYGQTLSLPLYPSMTERDIEFVVQKIKDITGASDAGSSEDSILRQA